jgi:hypothetical protein
MLAVPSANAEAPRSGRWAVCGQWREVAPAFDGFTPRGVAVVSPKEAWIVGGPNTDAGPPVALRWDGMRWLRTSVPHDPEAYYVSLHAVAVVSANDVWAVGISHRPAATKPVTARWDGAAWHRVAIGIAGLRGELDGVTVIPGTRQLWAVGTQYVNGGQGQQTLTLRWTGDGWRRVSSPNPSEVGNLLYDVTSVGGVVWAVGESYGPDAEYSLILRWIHGRWTVVASPSPGVDETTVLEAIAGASRGAIWAVGWYARAVAPGEGSPADHGLILRWDGQRWSVATKLTSRSRLHDLVVAAPGDVWAVGDVQADRMSAPLVLRRQSGPWVRSGAPRPETPYDASLIGIDGTPHNLWAPLQIAQEESITADAYHRC